MRTATTAVLTTLLFIGLGCTEKREPEKHFPVMVRSSSEVQAVADIHFDGKETRVDQIVTLNNSLYVTGGPFGIARWDIGADPEAPKNSFAMSDNIEDFNRTRGAWVVPWYASYGLAIKSGFAVTSGSSGASVVDVRDTHRPLEAYRYPDAPRSGPAPRDEAFVYKAIVAHPSQPVLFGFREQDFVYKLKIDESTGALTPESRSSYGEPGQTVCCVRSATTFANKVFVALTNKIWAFDLDASGGLGTKRDLAELQAIRVTTSKRFLYIQHKALSSQPGSTTNPSGIYVYDEAGEAVNFLPLSPLTFAVSDDDRYLYANMDDKSLRVYKILWTNY